MIVVLISANAEWPTVKDCFPAARVQTSPIGEWFEAAVAVNGRSHPVTFLHGGWGKIAAASSAQYAISRWSPKLLINLGTCGGFAGAIAPGDVVLAERTVIYDIIEQMTDAEEAIAHYATELDLSWLTEPYPLPVTRTLLVSADRDLVAEELPHLQETYGAVAGDWESGAIAWVAARNDTRCLIVRGVTDVVGADGGEVYEGNFALYLQRAAVVMRRLLDSLPGWLADLPAEADG